MLEDPRRVPRRRLAAFLSAIEDPVLVASWRRVDARTSVRSIYNTRARELAETQAGAVAVARLNPAALCGDAVVVGRGRTMPVTDENRAELEAMRFDRGGVQEPLYLIEEY
jgi:hypothetical protein